MIRNRDPDARLDDLTALMDASSPSDLHRALVLGPPAAYEREISTPLTCFRKAHDHDRTRAVETAMLLATDPRWRVTAGPLMKAIDATDIVPPDEFDLLARAFVSADTNVYWTCPDDWFSNVAIIVFESDDVSHSLDPDPDPDDTDEPGPTVAARMVSPGLRRWASERLLRLDPSRWADVSARAKELGGDGGGGLIRGILDSIDALPWKARTLVRQEALQSGRSDVRQAALQQIAVIQWSLARTLGMRDANERIRRWASGLTDPAMAPSATTDAPSAPAPSASRPSSATQVSLFD